jgi:hypothetical protein
MPNPITGLDPFNYKDAVERNGKFLIAYLKSAVGGERSFDDAEAAAKLLHGFIGDSMGAIGEVQRLYTVLDGLKRRHMPLPGEPGAPVKCTSCSMHGAEVLWPCEPYKTADAALPEGWPL